MSVKDLLSSLVCGRGLAHETRCAHMLVVVVMVASYGNIAGFKAVEVYLLCCITELISHYQYYTLLSMPIILSYYIFILFIIIRLKECKSEITQIIREGAHNEKEHATIQTCQLEHFHIWQITG